MNKRILFLILLIFIFIIPCNGEDNYIIDGDVVYINDENVYLSAYPHTIYESGYVYFNLTSKNYNGNIDAAFGFNISSVKPKKAELYNLNTNTWINFPLSFTLLTYSYQNCDKWYYIKDVPIISNKNYMIRIWIETPITTNINKGKYLFAVKPSFETIQQSIDNNRLYVLDPWFNTSFTDRQKIIITTNGTTIPQNYQILLNVSYNQSMQSDFSDLRFTNLSNGSLPYWIQSKVNSEYVNVWINFSNEIIHPNTDIIYMYFGNDNLNDEGNENDVFIASFHGNQSIWIKDDPNSHISFINERVEILGLTRNEDAYIYKSIPNGNYTFDVDIYCTGGDNYGKLSISQGDIIDDFNNINNGYGFNIYIYDSKINIISQCRVSDVLTSGSVISDLNLNTWYYITMVNNETVLKVYVYSNSDRTLLIDTSYINISDVPHTMAYAYLVQSVNTGNSNAYNGYNDNLTIRKYIINEPIISYGIIEYYTNTLYYNATNNYNHTIESDGTIIVNRSLNEIDNTYWSAKSTNITYWIFTKKINNTGYTNFTIEKDNLNNFSVKLKQYSYYNLSNSSLVNTFGTNQYGNANININLIPDDYYILFINQSLTPPPIKPLYPIQGILIFKDNLCINNINKIIVYKNNSYIGIYNYSDEITFLNNTNYTFFINYDNIDIINSENFLITFFKKYGYMLISIIGIIIIIGICIYFFKKVKR